MINEELYRRCLMAVAPKENKRLWRANNIDISGPPVDAPKELLIKEVTKIISRRKYVTIYDISKFISVKSDAIRAVMNKLVRDGIIMSGQDASAKRTIYWMPKDDDGFVPMISRSKTTRDASIERRWGGSRLVQIEREREMVLDVMPKGKWVHANNIAAKINVRVPIVRGHLRRLSEAGLVDERKMSNRTYWKIADAAALAAK